MSSKIYLLLYLALFPTLDNHTCVLTSVYWCMFVVFWMVFWSYISSSYSQMKWLVTCQQMHLAPPMYLCSSILLLFQWRLLTRKFRFWSSYPLISASKIGRKCLAAFHCNYWRACYLQESSIFFAVSWKKCFYIVFKTGIRTLFHA